jgi:hypothetical protein
VGSLAWIKDRFLIQKEVEPWEQKNTFFKLYEDNSEEENIQNIGKGKGSEAFTHGIGI